MKKKSLENNDKRFKIKKNYLIILIYLAITTILQYFFNWSVQLYIACSIGIIILCTCVTRFDVLHPLVWYVPIFIIYQISYPWLKIMNVETGIIEPLNENYVILNWIAICVIVVFLGNLKCLKYNRNEVEAKINKPILDVGYILIILISILGIMYSATSGFNSKYDIAHSSNIVLSITSMAINMINIITIYICLNKNNSKRKKICVFIISLIIMFFGMGILGERDLIIRYAVVFLLYYVAVYRPKKRKIFALIFSIIILISISSSLKMFMVRDNEKNEENGLIVRFLSSDFQASGFNFNYLLNREAQWDFKYGSTLIYDLLSPFADFINFSDRQISTSWYQNTFFSSSKTGRGFSIIAEGYVNFSTFGIILWMFIICFFIRMLYLRSNKSMYAFIIYICACPMLMYISRADLANFISPFVKYILLTAIIIYVISERKEKNGNIN